MKLYEKDIHFAVGIEFFFKKMLILETFENSNFGIDLNGSTSISAEMATFTGEVRELENLIYRPSRRVQKCYLANFKRQLPIFS